MGRRSLRSPAETVQRAKSLIAAAIADSRSTHTAARNLGYSEAHLRDLFRREAGTTIERFRRQTALDLAARLLVATDDSVTAVALQCGYRDLGHFCQLFRLRYDVTPRRYRARRGGGGAGGPRPWMADAFRSPDTKRWTRIDGHWSWSDRAVHAENTGQMLLELAREIPDGFVVEAEVRVLPLPGYDRPQVGFSISAGGYPLAVRLALVPRPFPSQIQRDDLPVDREVGPLHEGRWHHVRARFDRETIEVAVDHRSLFQHHVLFPPPQDRWARLGLVGYYGRVSWRNLRVYSRPAPSGGTPEAVGDGFHADGRLAEAIEAYRSAANDPVVGGRLCLKIAACWRRARLVERERAWLLAASATAGRGPWSTFGRLGLGRLRSEAHFTRELAAALRIPRERKAAALLAEEEVRIAQRQGRFAFADAGARVVLDHGGALGPATTLYAGIFDSLVSQGRFLEAAREARELADKPSTAASEREVLALEEAYALTMARRTSAAFALTDSITRDASGPRIRMRASHTRAIALRASGRSTQAEEVFRDVARQAPAFGGHEVAIFHLAVLLALRGATEEADLAMGNIRGFESEYAIVGPALLRVIDGDYESACATLDGEIENRTRRRLRVHPRGILVAALLHEITGRPEKARMAFESVRRAADGGDPEEAAAAFYLGERDRVRFDRELSRFPTAAEPITRTVLCYLEGTRLERRGDVDEARRYYVRTVTEDPSRYWPSVLAERRLRDWVPPSPQPSPP